MLETKYQHMLLHPSPQNQIYPAQCIECIAKARSIKGVYQLLNSLVGNLLSRDLRYPGLLPLMNEAVCTPCKAAI